MTLTLTSQADLISPLNGSSYVEFKGARYLRDDIVPPLIFPMYLAKVLTLPYIIPKTAGDFVAACMTDKFGLGKTWPDSAQDFLWPVGEAQKQDKA